MDNGPALSRTRVTLGLVGVAAGTAWAVGGAAELRWTGRLILVVLPVLLVAVAVVRVLRVTMPPGTVAGPVSLLGLAGVCAGVAVVAFGWVSGASLARIGAVVLMGGGVVVALSRRYTNSELETGIRRRTAVMVTVDKDKKVTGVAPVKSVVRSVLGGTVHLDLSAATFPTDADPMVVDITLLFGRVEIIVPRAWQVRAGRVELARRVWFGGDLDMAEPWSADEDDDVDCVALNVQGLGGAVCLRRS